MNELMKKIEQSGAKVCSETLNNPLTIYPHFRDNAGFFHIKGPDFETAVIKGVYKDNIRTLTGECPLDSGSLSSLAQISADTERSLRYPVILKVCFDDENKPHIFDADIYIAEHRKTDKRDPHIESPLTKVEKSLGKAEFISDHHLFCRNPFAEIFPDTLSPALMSLISEVPDILNPLFASCSIKTKSPSVSIMFGRLYMNITNTETIIPAFRQATDFFNFNYAPSLYRKIKKPSFGIPDDSDLKISDKEILEAIEDIKLSTDDILPEDIYGDDFAELPALAVMTWEMLYIRMWKSFTAMSKILGRDFSTALKTIYSTRSDTILNSDISGIHSTFDPSVPADEFRSLNIEHVTKEDAYRSLPASRRLTLSRSRFYEKLDACHKYLKLRDELFTLCSKLTAEIRRMLLETGGSFVKDSMLTDADDIFFFEMNEIKKILSDEYFGNIPFTIGFRKWQNARFSAMCLPNLLYGKDIKKAGELSQAQMDRSRREKIIPCIGLNHKETVTDNYAVHRSYSLTDIHKSAEKELMIAESASIFSYIAEYAFATDTPLYTGARFAALLLKDKKITTSENGISYE